jgi:hypothetical protein
MAPINATRHVADYKQANNNGWQEPTGCPTEVGQKTLQQMLVLQKLTPIAYKCELNVSRMGVWYTDQRERPMRKNPARRERPRRCLEELKCSQLN